MQLKTLCYYMMGLVPGLILNGKESIRRPLQRPVQSASTTILQPTTSPQTLLIHKNKTPTVWIFTPVVNDKHIEVFGYSEDEEEGSIPDKWYCWEIEHRHGRKIIQTLMIQSTKSLTFEISRKQQSRNHDWYRLRLTVSDTGGNVGKDSVDLYLSR